MKDVWVLQLTWEADFPHPESYGVEGVYTSWARAAAEKDRLIKKWDCKDGPGIKGWTIMHYQINGGLES